MGRKSDLPGFLQVIQATDIFCLQETKGEVHVDGYKCFNKLRKGSRSGGICIGVRRELQAGVSQMQTVDEDFQAVKLSKSFFRLERDLVVVNVYNSPENSSFKANRKRDESTLEMLNSLLGDLASTGDILLAGDLNARIGNHPDYLLADRSIKVLEQESGILFPTQPRERLSRDPVKNSNGQALLDLLISNNVTLLNGRTIGDISGDYTCLKYNGSSVVDYIGVSTQLFHSVRSFRCQEFNDLSDHKPIQTILKIKNSFIMEKQPEFETNPARFKWNRDQGAAEEFSKAQDDDGIRKSLETFLKSTRTDSSELNKDLTDLIHRLANKALPLKSKKKRTNKNQWFDWECRIEKRSLADQARLYGQRPSDEQIRAVYFQQRKKYKKMIRRKKKQFLCDLNSKIEHGKCVDWKMFKKLKCCQQEEDVFDNYDLYSFYKYYTELFSHKSLSDGRLGEIDHELSLLANSNPLCEYLDQDISPSEIDTSINKLKVGKSTSKDLISSEMLKNLNSDFRKAVLKLFNSCLRTRSYLWNCSTMTPLLKKGDKYNPDNYRSICVGSTLGKLYSNIFLERLMTYRNINCPTPINQLGFCKGAQTADHLLTFTTVVNKYCSTNKKSDSLFTAFVDFRKAFDTVCRQALMLKISRLGIGGDYLGSLQYMYSHSKTQVKLIDKLSAVIDILIGTEQGHPMSPELFKVYIHELSELLEAAGAITPLLNNIPVSHLLWADDLILMALDQESLQKLLNCLNEFCTNWGLSVNPDKTKVMVFNKSGKSYHSDKEFSLGKVKLQHTSTYCYLGLQFNTGGTFNLATEELRKKSIRAYFGLKRTVDVSSLSFKSLTRLYDSLIKPILTYGCVVWLPYSSIFKALTEVSENSLKKLSQDPMEKAHLQFIKYSLGVHKKASNVGSWGETGRYPLGITILKQVVSYFNNLAVKGDDGTLLQHAFIEQKKLGLPWYTNITKLVTNLADMSQSQSNPPSSHSTIESAKSVFRTLWQDQLNQQTKLRFYKSIKDEFAEEPYLSLDWKYRTALTRLRISAHNLNIERGRYSRSDNALAIQRLCPYCCTSDVAYLSELPFPDNYKDPIIEDEAHVLSTCPAYHHVRLMLPDNLKTALLKRDYLTVFALMDNHQTAFMMGKATQKMLLTRKNMELKN